MARCIAMKPLALALALAALGGCSVDRPATASPPPEMPPLAHAETRILAPAMAEKLKANTGVTLQWIDWNTRGIANVRVVDGEWFLTGAQASSTGQGRLYLDGKVTEIGADYFLFDGTIRITETPDAGRQCEAKKVWRFAVTQNRPYWRLREFEWCDDLTDYVDIYMPGTRP